MISDSSWKDATDTSILTALFLFVKQNKENYFEYLSLQVFFSGSEILIFKVLLYLTTLLSFY